jgi:hypothetical protein
MKQRKQHPTLAYLLVVIASVAFSAAQPALDQAPEGNAVAFANGIASFVAMASFDDGRGTP